MVIKEINNIKRYCEKNVHEYCAFHLLQTLLKKMVDTSAIELSSEIDWTNMLIIKYQEYYGYESMHPGLTQVNYADLESLKKHLKFLEYLSQKK